MGIQKKYCMAVAGLIALQVGLDAAVAEEADEAVDDGEWEETEEDFEGDDWGDSGWGDEIDRAVDIHGSFENQLTGMVPRDERLVLYDGLRLRVDLDANLPKGIKLRSDVVARLFVGETGFPMQDIVPAQTLEDLVARDPRWQMALEDEYALENEFYLDNAYLKIPVARALVILGKQPLEQGAGYAWNPTDVFTVKDMLDPTYEKEGVVALRTIIPICDWGSLDLVAAPDGKLKRWTVGGRGSVRMGPVSLSGVSYLTRVKKTDLEGSMDAMEAAALMGDDPEDAVVTVDAERIMVGGDAVVDIQGVRVWAEGAYNFVENKSGATADWWELSGGAEYYFPSETHFMIEYFHYGRGPSQLGGTYYFNDWMGLLSMDLKMLGQDFLFESIDHPIADFWTVGVSSFQGLNDASAAIMGDLRWAFAEDMELWLLLSVTAGEPEDFMSSARGQGWLRLKAFF